MKSPYVQFEMPIHLNFVCAEYLSARNVLRDEGPRTHVGIATQAKKNVLADILDYGLALRFQDRVGGSIYGLTTELDSIEFPQHEVTWEWCQQKADVAIDAYFERARQSVGKLTESINEITKAVQAMPKVLS